MRKILAVVAIASLMMLGGCASTATSTSATSKSKYNDDVDWEFVTLISRDARMRGHDIVWVNPPMKKKTASSTQ